MRHTIHSIRVCMIIDKTQERHVNQLMEIIELRLMDGHICLSYRDFVIGVLGFQLARAHRRGLVNTSRQYWQRYGAKGFSKDAWSF